MNPTLTLSGVDERVSQRELERLLDCPDLELGLLYTHSPDGRPRYPELHWLIWAAELAAGRCAIHICGGRARAALLAQQLGELLAPAARIQVNGVLSPEEVATICQLYPRHTVITQHHAENSGLVEFVASNHALLVDASGGAGRRPGAWSRPATAKPVGFAGGLGPVNLASDLTAIASIAGAGPWWIDAETSLRIDDWFSPLRAAAMINTYRTWCRERTERASGGRVHL